MIRIEGQLYADEQVAAQLLHRGRDKGGRRVRGLVWVFIVLLLGLYGARTLDNPRFGWMFAIILIAPAVLLVHRYVLLPRRLHRLFQEQDSLIPPLSLEITGEGLQGEGDAAARPWSNFAKWVENDSVLLLYHSDATFQIIPTRLLENADDLEQLRVWLQTKIGPAS